MCIASFRVANQLRRFGREPDIGSGGSRDLIFGQSGSQAPWGARTYFGSPIGPSYGSELAADLDFKIREDKVRRRRSATSGRSRSTGFLPGGPRENR
jgi:hypothetical protein